MSVKVVVVYDSHVVVASSVGHEKDKVVVVVSSGDPWVAVVVGSWGRVSIFSMGDVVCCVSLSVDVVT